MEDASSGMICWADMLNPYASQLGESDPREVIASTPAKLREAIAKVGHERADEPRRPGGWSAREIVCHLADCEVVFAYRLRQTLSQDGHVIQPFDQDLWAKKYAAYSMEAALNTFSVVREWNLALIRSLDAGERARPVTHPERGEMTLETIVETMGGHDRNHLQQLGMV